MQKKKKKKEEFGMGRGVEPHVGNVQNRESTDGFYPIVGKFTSECSN